MSNEPLIFQNDHDTGFNHFDGIDDEASSETSSEATVTDLGDAEELQRDLENDLDAFEDLEISSASGVIGSRQFVERSQNTNTSNTQNGASSSDTQNGESSSNTQNGASSSDTQNSQSGTSSSTPNERELPFQCLRCGFRWATQEELDRHKKLNLYYRVIDPFGLRVAARYLMTGSFETCVLSPTDLQSRLHNPFK